MLKESIDAAVKEYNGVVLILILMEHAQRAHLLIYKSYKMGLNPYFNGTCSKSR